MAKDGTMRGGARPGSGPKRKALTEKISAGKAATVIDLPEASDLVGVEMPAVKLVNYGSREAVIQNLKDAGCTPEMMECIMAHLDEEFK